MPNNSPDNGVYSPNSNNNGTGAANRDTLFNSWTQRSWFKTEVLLRILLILMILIAGSWLVNGLWQIVISFSSLLLLFFTAWLFALMLTPLVRYFVHLNWPIPVAIGAVYSLVLAGLIGFGILVLPDLIAQTQLLSQNLGGITSVLEKNVNNLLKGFGITNIDLGQASSQFQSFGNDLLKNALNVATSVANFIVQLLLLLIVSISILAGREYHEQEIKTKEPSTFWQHLPAACQRWGNYIKGSFERNFGVFLLGQFTVAVGYGLVTGILMWLTGFDYPITTGCICGALMIIPFFGGPLSLLPPLIVAFNRDNSPIIVVLILLFLFQTILLNVVLPKLVGKSSGVGPVTTLFVLLAGAQIGGVFGVLLAVPITGVVKSLLTALLNEFAARQEASPKPTVAATPVATTVASTVGLEIVSLVSTDREK